MNKRKTKNFIAILLLIILVISSILTINYSKNNLSINNNQKEIPGGSPGNGPPNGNMPNRKESSDNNTNDNNEITPPEKPSEDNNKEDNNSNNSIPTPPSNDNNNIKDFNNNTTANISTLSIILFGIESIGIASIIVYLIMSNFNKKEIKETFKTSDKLIIYILTIIILATCFTTVDVFATKNISLNNNINDQPQSNNTSTEATGSIEVDGKEETLTDNYTTNTSDESAIVVKNNGNATISNATINKTGGDSSNIENSEFYGINAGILVTENSTSTIKDTNITTNAKGSNAVFATGNNAKIYISNSTIKTTGTSSSRGLDSTYGGYIEADNVNITTKGDSCATLATDRGEGTVIVKNSSLETNGKGSPLIYSTGKISISNTKGTSNGSQLVVIEGKNSTTVDNSNIKASGEGNRNNVDNAGVMIYQSMSGDASEGTGTFTAKNSTLTIDSNSNYYKTAPMFFITNTDAVINIENTKLEYGSNILISSKGTTEWGTTGSNGGNTTLNATNQSLKGNIEIDNISTLIMNLKSSSTYKGTINKDNTAKNIKIVLDKTSKITLTGDSYITELDDEIKDYSNINFNGYKLYVNGKAIN